MKQYLESEVAKNEMLRFGEPSKYWKGPIKTLVTPVPTLRVNARPGNLQCDITFSNGLGVENTKLIRYMFALQPEAFKLYHFARIWIHIDEFNFKRYMVALLVIFYLQTRNLMPSVASLQDDIAENFIGGEFWRLAAEDFFGRLSHSKLM